MASFSFSKKAKMVRELLELNQTIFSRDHLVTAISWLFYQLLPKTQLGLNSYSSAKRLMTMEYLGLILPNMGLKRQFLSMIIFHVE
jgi:hypothetical protein